MEIVREIVLCDGDSEGDCYVMEIVREIVLCDGDSEGDSVM